MVSLDEVVQLAYVHQVEAIGLLQDPWEPDGTVADLVHKSDDLDLVTQAHVSDDYVSHLWRSSPRLANKAKS